MKKQQQMPALTAPQSLVMSMCRSEISGPQLREKLSSRRSQFGSTSFYELVSRLESLGYLASMMQTIRVANVVTRERRYKITRPGRAALKATIDFYQSLS